MMRLLAAALLVATSPVMAETILVEPGDGHRFVGDKFNAREVNQVLYEDRPCKLPLVNAKHMREYSTKSIAIPMKACWGRLIGGDVAIILENGDSWKSPEIAYVTTSVDKNGSGVVTKSFYKKKN
ncbi:hypothetical protein H7A76_30655 [Pseudomonas sp. MSSRFD41]|uniref:hypothetical protein n=1 Tax=Pseudomonas sp. MSSRFD41 TaxID=1310370 RepID=UPI00163AA29B|nr:hypothetical protein [Pseudomonas sp. MSSRFD41]MBC2659817.1 hypothetical protein [Pseudomonas sp. MSSRFD41]